LSENYAPYTTDEAKNVRMKRVFNNAQPPGVTDTRACTHTRNHTHTHTHFWQCWRWPSAGPGTPRHGLQAARGSLQVSTSRCLRFLPKGRVLPPQRCVPRSSESTECQAPRLPTLRPVPACSSQRRGAEPWLHRPECPDVDEVPGLLHLQGLESRPRGPHIPFGSVKDRSIPRRTAWIPRISHDACPRVSSFSPRPSIQP